MSSGKTQQGKTQKTESKYSPIPLIKGVGSPTLHIDSQLLAEIFSIHSRVPKGVEFCAALLYKIEKGIIDKPDKLELRAFKCLPLNIGNGSYTEANMNDHLADIYQAFPEADYVDYIIEDKEIPKNPYKVGMLHTHHTMGVFFSGEDEDELKQSTPFHTYYLSLIVNYRGDLKARLCLPTDVEVKNIIKFKDDKGRIKKYTISNTVQKVIYFDCDIQLDIESDENQSVFEQKFSSIYTTYRKKAEALKSYKPKQIGFQEDIQNLSKAQKRALRKQKKKERTFHDVHKSGNAILQQQAKTKSLWSINDLSAKLISLNGKETKLLSEVLRNLCTNLENREDHPQFQMYKDLFDDSMIQCLTGMINSIHTVNDDTLITLPEGERTILKNITQALVDYLAVYSYGSLPELSDTIIDFVHGKLNELLISLEYIAEADVEAQLAMASDIEDDSENYIDHEKLAEMFPELKEEQNV